MSINLTRICALFSLAMLMTCCSTAFNHHTLPSAHRRGEEQLQIPTSAGVRRDDGLHMLQIAYLRVGSLASVRLDRQVQRARRRYPAEITERRLAQAQLCWPATSHCYYSLHLGDCARFAMVAWWHRSPFLRQRNHRTGVEHAEPEQMVKLQPDPIHRPVEPVLGVKERVALRCQHGQMLHIAPGQRWAMGAKEMLVNIA